MDPNIFFGDIKFNDLIIWILGFTTIVGLLDMSGLLPNRLAKWFARNRLESTLTALRRLDVRISWDENTGSIKLIDHVLDLTHIKEHAYKAELRDLLKEDTFKGQMQIGGTTVFSSEEFIDVMGATAESTRAIHYAKLLQTHYKIENLPAFDIIATPRAGSPILGYEFARLSQKPFVMGTSEKVKDKNQIMGNHSMLDYPKTLSLAGKVVMLVDDSTTGGRKQIELAKKLRAAGAKVNISLALFEPQGKGAREKLAAEGITLHSIIPGPVGNY